MLFAGAGYFWLMMGVKIRYIIFLGAAIVACNFIYELWINILNTPDIVDAYFGVAGVVLAYVFLFVTHSFGLKPNPLPEKSTAAVE